MGDTPKSFLSVPPLQGSGLLLNPIQGLAPLAISWRPVGAPEVSETNTTGQAEATMSSRRKSVSYVSV